MVLSVENRADIEPLEPSAVPVVIVGSGPVGLTMGLGLSRYGIASLILGASDKLSDGSRAICVQRHTLQIFDWLGAVKPMLEKGVTWTLGRVFSGEQELFQIRFPGASSEKFPPFINLQQFYTEQYLMDTLNQQSLCEVRWKHKVVGLREIDDKVEVVVETPNGTKYVKAHYVIACDGSRSSVRQMLNIGFEGKTYNDRFLIVDVQAELDRPNERWFWFDPVFNRGKSALIHPQPDGVWRIDWQLGADIEVEAELEPARLDKRIKEVIGDRPYKIEWSSMYTFHQRCATKYRAGRVFLAGDAAHLMSPFGARGMNSGVQDANNLIWKLAYVLKGFAPDALLDTYEVERRAAAKENLHITDESMAFITPHSRYRLILRNAILRGSVRFKPLRKLVNSGRLSQPFRYPHSPIVSLADYLPSAKELAKSSKLLKQLRDFRRAVKPGHLVPDAFYHLASVGGNSVPDAKEQKRWQDLLGHDFVILYFTDKPQAVLAQFKQAQQEAPNIPAKLYLVTSQSSELSAEAGWQATVLWDADGSFARTYAAQPGTLYVVRPDGHLAARGMRFPLAKLGEVLRLATGIKIFNTEARSFSK